MKEPGEAIKSAFKIFEELFEIEGSPEITHRLLEKVELQDGSWRVVIGFDIGRHKSVKHSNHSVLAIGPETHDPIREYREIFLDAKTGEFEKVGNLK